MKAKVPEHERSTRYVFIVHINLIVRRGNADN